MTQFYFRISCLLMLLAGTGIGQTYGQGKTPKTMITTPMQVYAVRLRPGQDLKQELMRLAREQGIKAGSMVTCVGSLQEINLRYANQAEGTRKVGKFEIVSLVGTLADNGAHLHLSVSDSTGVTLGGHLMDGNIIYTTAELVIGVMPELEFARETDPTYGYQELVVRKRKK